MVQMEDKALNRLIKKAAKRIRNCHVYADEKLNFVLSDAIHKHTDTNKCYFISRNNGNDLSNENIAYCVETFGLCFITEAEITQFLNAIYQLKNHPKENVKSAVKQLFSDLKNEQGRTDINILMLAKLIDVTSYDTRQLVRSGWVSKELIVECTKLERAAIRHFLGDFAMICKRKFVLFTAMALEGYLLLTNTCLSNDEKTSLVVSLERDFNNTLRPYDTQMNLVLAQVEASLKASERGKTNRRRVKEKEAPKTSKKQRAFSAIDSLLKDGKTLEDITTNNVMNRFKKMFHDTVTDTTARSHLKAYKEKPKGY